MTVNAHTEPRPQSRSTRTDEMQQNAEKRLRTAPPTFRTPPNIDDGAPAPQRNSPPQKPRPHCSTRHPPSRWNAPAPIIYTRWRIPATLGALKPRTYPPATHMPKANNRNRTRSEIYSKLIIKTERGHWRLFALFIVNFEHIHSLF